ncbi:structural maintenance of chromosomes protein 6 [Trichonephila clavipes]|nr:structural maintenance of chromosomes protein 6 [Trichonephila clavipes]
MDFPTTTTKIWVLAYYCNNADVQDNLPSNPDFTCVNLIRMKRPAKKETLDTAKKRKKFDLSQSEGKLGLIESVSVQNFMCHDNLSLSLGPHMNFIIGQNGSGKSAILTAIILALGGKASTTDRYSNVKGFVKKGKNKGKVEVVLRNTGILAYKPEEYGEKIIIVREFNKEGTSSYKIKSESGTICSVHKKELENIVEAMDIPVKICLKL